MKSEFDNETEWGKWALHQVKLPVFYFDLDIKFCALYRALNQSKVHFHEI